jgi:hypothetical protein
VLGVRHRTCRSEPGAMPIRTAPAVALPRSNGR